jgi:hypothetical protein
MSNSKKGFWACMPNFITFGSKGWEVHKFVNKSQVGINKDGSKKFTTSIGYKLPSYAEYSQHGKCPYTREELKTKREDYNATIAGYKKIWEFCNRDSEKFESFMEQVSKGEIISTQEMDDCWSFYERIGKGSNWKNRDSGGDCCDKYDFGSWTMK